MKTSQEILNDLIHLKEQLTRIASEQEKLVLVARTRLARGTKPNIASAVLKDVQEHPGATRKEIAQRVSLPPEQVTKIVVGLHEHDQLVRVGSRRTTRWFTPESLEKLTKPST